MRIKFLLFCTFCIAVFTSCAKITGSGPSSAKGQVIDKTTGKGVPYAYVFIIGNGGTVGATGNTQNGTATADANGNYSVSFNAVSGNYYNVTAKSQFYFEDQAISTISIDAGSNNNVKIPMLPEGFVKFYLVNEPPLDTADQISVGDFDNAFNFSPIHKDTSAIVYGFGNTMTHFSIKITDRNGVYHQHFDSIYLKALDTVSYTIKY